MRQSRRVQLDSRTASASVIQSRTGATVSRDNIAGRRDVGLTRRCKPSLAGARSLAGKTVVGATAAETLDGTSRPAGCRFPSFSSSVPSPSPVVVPPTFCPFSSPTRLSFSPRNLATTSGEALYKRSAHTTASCESRKGPNTPGLRDFQSWRGQGQAGMRQNAS